MKKVILVGATLVVIVGCNVFAASGDKTIFSEKIEKMKNFKAKCSNSMEIDNSDSSGDIIKERNPKTKKYKKARKNKRFENLTEEEKSALKEQNEALKNKKNLNKEHRIKSTDSSVA